MVCGLFAASGCQGLQSSVAPAATLVRRTAEFVRPAPEVTAAPDPTRLATKSPPPSSALHTAMAQLLEQAEEDGGAEVHYQQALALEPENLDAQLGYAHLLTRSDRLEEAAAWFERACQDHPQSATAQNDLGLCYAQCGRTNDALRPLTDAVTLAPDSVLYRNNIAQVLVELGRPEQALGELAAVHAPAVAHYNTGYLLQARGERQRAAVHFQQAIAFDPDFAPAQTWTAELARQEVAQPTSGPNRLVAGQQPVGSDKLY